MGQITIYIDDQVQSKIKKMAKSMNLSVSKCITQILEQKTSNVWDSSIRQLSGAWEDFPDTEEIRSNQYIPDSKRDSF